jgi:hypothetical protein
MRDRHQRLAGGRDALSCQFGESTSLLNGEQYETACNDKSPEDEAAQE